MSQTNLTTSSKWLISAPIKFSILLFSLMLVVTGLKSFLFDKIFSGFISSALFSALLFIAFTASTIFLIKRLPNTKLDRRSFIGLHISQTLILSVCFYILSYVLISHSQYILLKLMLLEANSFGLLILIMLALGLFLLYLAGIFISNIYAKILRIQAFNIPLWKVLGSFPFGFAGLWTAGFLLNTNNKKDPVITYKNSWYNRIINWTLAQPTNTIAMFIIITLISCLFFGPLSIMRTFILALVYGIWVLQVGAKKFKSNIAGTYSTMTFIINIVIILSIITFALFAPTGTETVTVNIADTEYITDYNQGQ